MRLSLFSLGGLLAASALTLQGGAATATVTALHGIANTGTEGTKVDVCINGAKIPALNGFAFGEARGPLQLPLPGVYNVAVVLPGGACTDIAVENTFDLSGVKQNVNATIVAYVTADEQGMPGPLALGLDVNNTKPIRGVLRSRIQVQHRAIAPAVDISVRRPYFFHPTVTIPDIANGDSPEDALVYKGWWSVELRPAGMQAPTFGPFRFRLKARRLYSIYAIGDLSGDFMLKAIEIPVDRKYFDDDDDHDDDDDEDDDEDDD